MSCWNSFVRVYDENFHLPLYSSLVVGQWDTITQAGGDNTDLFGIYKTNLGVICVGRQKADTSGNAIGNNIPVTNVTPWGTSTPQNESAILVYYQAANLHNSGDSISNNVNSVNSELSMLNEIEIYPNPTSEEFQLSGLSFQQQYNYSISSLEGKILLKGKINSSSRNISVKNLAAGIYLLNISEGENILIRKLSVIK